MAAKLSGPGGKGKFELGQNADINVTPFVDVMLVLLIIFMVAAPLATVSIRLDLPPATPSTSQPEEPVVVSIQRSGSVYIGDQETAPARLAADLNARFGITQVTEERVFVRADEQVRYVAFMEVLNALQDGGYYQIALISEDFNT
ncbi:MAG: biopolymer transporter ExbD [Proteobacteria bacterium]|nr:biopolymer transporter ExbD [Pseudomonadota bacterium]